MKELPIPAGLYKLAARVEGDYALFILLDGYPYCEFEEKTPGRYKASLEAWKRAGNLTQLNSPGRVDVRFFVRGQGREISEIKPNKL
jgi:hypothetical protein